MAVQSARCSLSATDRGEEGNQQGESCLAPSGTGAKLAPWHLPMGAVVVAIRRASMVEETPGSAMVIKRVMWRG